MGTPRVVHRLRFAREALGLLGTVRTAPRWLVHPEYLVLARDMTRPYAPAPAFDDVRWTSLGPADLDHVHALNPALSVPEMRRRLRAGYRCLLASAPNWIFADQTVRRTIALAAPWNRAALRLGLERADYEVVGTIKQWRLGPWRRTFATGAVALEGRRAFRVLQTPARVATGSRA